MAKFRELRGLPALDGIGADNPDYEIVGKPHRSSQSAEGQIDSFILKLPLPFPGSAGGQ
jgi:hypothetical protein